MNEKLPSKPLLLDLETPSASAELPAFLARPSGAPPYHGFPIIPESETDGWLLGTITEHADPNGCRWGDAYVAAPGGSRAGLVWEVGEGVTEQIVPPDEERWGVYAVWFPRVIHNTNEFVEAFRRVLPGLQAIHAGLAEQTETRAAILKGIASGERAVKEERTFTQNEAKLRLSRWFDESNRWAPL